MVPAAHGQSTPPDADAALRPMARAARSDNPGRLENPSGPGWIATYSLPRPGARLNSLRVPSVPGLPTYMGDSHGEIQHPNVSGSGGLGDVPRAGAMNPMRMRDETFENLEQHEQHSGSALADRSPMLEISNAMVRLYKEAFGRGPTKARAQFAGPDTLIVILESSLTVAERNLVAMGEHQRLREARLFFQYALEDQFRAIVEQALGRRTVAFVSGLDTRRDVAMEVFTLEPAGGGDALPEK